VKGIRAGVRITQNETGKCDRLILGTPQIGENFWLGHWSTLDASGGDLIIGDNVTVCGLVTILTHSNEDRDQFGTAPFCGSLIIGEGAFIGTGAVIEPRTKIGKYARIGANSFVRRETIVGDYETWAGCPAVFKKVRPK
jgi:acetyltransferase-like isoleucine patch superfamily enzyme